jgi:hypothetical protein
MDPLLERLSRDYCDEADLSLRLAKLFHVREEEGGEGERESWREWNALEMHLYITLKHTQI